MLPEVIDAVAGRAKIAVDGSFSRGSDIVKAICLGADWVGLGRLYCYGLAAAGAAGIERVIELLEEEMREVMGLSGRHQPEAARQELHRRRHADQPARRALSVSADCNLKDQGY